jgi:hypothetical protein
MTTPTLREAAQAALDALESLQGGCTDSGDGTVETLTVWCPEVVEALRAALAEDGRDWSLLEATQASLREHMFEVRRLRALAQPVPDAEPVAWMTRRKRDGTKTLPMGEATTNRAYAEQYKEWEWMPLYAAAHPQPAPQPLTEQQVWRSDAIMELNAHAGLAMRWLMELVRAIEQAHGIVPAPTTGEGKP